MMIISGHEGSWFISGCLSFSLPAVFPNTFFERGYLSKSTKFAFNLNLQKIQKSRSEGKYGVMRKLGVWGFFLYKSGVCLMN